MRLPGGHKLRDADARKHRSEPPAQQVSCGIMPYEAISGAPETLIEEVMGDPEAGL